MKFDMGYLFDQLPQNEKDMIIYRIEQHAGFGGNCVKMEAPLSHVLRFWDEEKEKFYRMFGNRFIVSKHISLRKSLSQMADAMQDFCDGAAFHKFYCWFSNTLQRTQDVNTYVDCSVLLNTTSLVDNKYCGRNIDLVLPNGKALKINKGCKTSRALGKIAEAFGCNPIVYEEFRIEHSQVLNEKYLDGELCLSIHPLDFMTMSDNECGWQSCMCWSEYCGEYRQGTVEMMNSPYVIMAYLKNSRDMYIGRNMEWTNKQWRQLFVVTPEVLMGIKQYPYQNDDLELEALNWIRDFAITANMGNFAPELCKLHPHQDDYYYNFNRQIYFSFDMHHMYNDITRSHMAYLNLDIQEETRTEYDYFLSGVTECLSCGEDFSDVYEDEFATDFLTCRTCANVERCYDCGDWFYAGSTNGDYIDGHWYCSYCCESYVSVCQKAGCGERTPTWETICLLGKHDAWGDNELEKVMCKYCYENVNISDEDIMYCYEPNSNDEFRTIKVNVTSWNKEQIMEVFEIDEDELKDLEENF